MKKVRTLIARRLSDKQIEETMIFLRWPKGKIISPFGERHEVEKTDEFGVFLDVTNKRKFDVRTHTIFYKMKSDWKSWVRGMQYYLNGGENIIDCARISKVSATTTKRWKYYFTAVIGDMMREDFGDVSDFFAHALSLNVEPKRMVSWLAERNELYKSTIKNNEPKREEIENNSEEFEEVAEEQESTPVVNEQDSYLNKRLKYVTILIIVSIAITILGCIANLIIIHNSL